MKIYPIGFEITKGEEENVVATISSHDYETFEVTVKEQILDSRDLREIADLLDLAKQKLINGI